MGKLAARVRMGVTLAAGAALLLWLHRFFPAGVLSLAVVLVLALLSVWELDRMGSFRGRKLAWTLTPAALVSAGFVAWCLFDGGRVAAPWALLGLYSCAAIFSWPWVRGTAGASIDVLDGRERLPVAREVVPLSLWLLPPLFAMVLVDRDFGIQGLSVLVVLAKIGDNAGYFVGRAIGKHHPFPHISPGKTVAGCVASLVAGTVAGALILPFTLGERSLAQGLLGALLGGLINAAAQAGDLSESKVKRSAGVKDSSPLFGPSGGTLDVIDSLLLAAPVALLLWSWVYGGSSR